MPLSPQLVSAAISQKFQDGADLDAFFKRIANTGYAAWFNAHVANRENWADKALGSGNEIDARFLSIWNSAGTLFPQMPFSLLQFAALMSIMTNEAGAHLMPEAELSGRAGFPGLAYAFSDIPGVKRSYNVSSLNKPAGDLFFADDNFWNAHQTLPAATLVRAQPALRQNWNSGIYPQSQFTCSLEPQESGFIQQADFYKFRGRGFIQITWRANYKRLVQFVQNYTGANTVVAGYKARWTGKDPDTVCTISTNADWDALFFEPQFVLACEAIAIHNQSSGDYLSLCADPAKLTALEPSPGSLYYMGWRISGAKDYAGLFTERVMQLLNTLNFTG